MESVVSTDKSVSLCTPITGLVHPDTDIAKVWLWIGTKKAISAKILKIINYNKYYLKVDKHFNFKKTNRIGITYYADKNVGPVFSTGFLIHDDLHLELTFNSFNESHLQTPALPFEEITIDVPSTYNHSSQVYAIRMTPIGGILEIEKSDTLLLSGMIIHIKFNNSSSNVITVQLISIKEHENNKQLSLQFIIERDSRVIASQFLLEHDELFSFQSLKPFLISSNRFKKSLLVNHVTTTPENFNEVLKLRRDANQYYGRKLNDNSLPDWSDSLDKEAIHRTVKLSFKTVGSVRLLINDYHKVNSEIGGFVNLPPWLLKKKFMEVSRLVIHPNYRSSHITVLLLREVARVVLEKNCDYILLDCIGKLKPIYQKLGAFELSGNKTHPYSNEKVHIMCIDIKKSLFTIDHKFLYWLYMFGPIVNHHVKCFGKNDLTTEMSTVQKLMFNFKLGISNAIY